MRREGDVQKSKILKYRTWDLNRCSAAFRLGPQEIAGQQTPVKLKRRISSASWRRPKMNMWGYPIVEEVDHENVS
jgi:hypothetical protein